MIGITPAVFTFENMVCLTANKLSSNHLLGILYRNSSFSSVENKNKYHYHKNNCKDDHTCKHSLGNCFAFNKVLLQSYHISGILDIYCKYNRTPSDSTFLDTLAIIVSIADPAVRDTTTTIPLRTSLTFT